MNPGIAAPLPSTPDTLSLPYPPAGVQPAAARPAAGTAGCGHGRLQHGRLRHGRLRGVARSGGAAQR